MGRWQRGAEIKQEKDQARMQTLQGLAIEAVQADTPPPNVGIIASALEPWAAGKTYLKNNMFTYSGKVGFVRQPSVTAQAHQPPFSTGMESVYGVRPKPDEYGRYPYVYNMAAKAGMVVTDAGAEYLCTRDIDPIIYSPGQVPAHFERR